MKRILNLSTIALSLLSLLLTLSSCGKKKGTKSDDVIASWISATDVPQSLGPGSTLTACSYDDGVITFRIETTPDSLKAIDKDLLKSTTIHNWQTNLNTQKLIEEIKKAEATLEYIYVADSDSIVMTLDAEEL